MARILRETLINHLKRISVGGQVKEVVFNGAFGAAALLPNHLLLVVAPDIADMEPLDGEVGVGDIKKLINSLGFIGGDGDQNADVDITVENNRLVIDESARNARIKLITANPKTISTRVNDETVDKLLDRIDQADAGSVALGVDLLDDVKAAYVGLKASVVKIIVGPNGGFIRVGTENEDGAEFFSTALVAPKERALNFGEELIKVFETVSGDVVMRLPGETSQTIAIDDEGFTYLLSAKAQGATATKPAVKKDVAAPSGEAGESAATEAPKATRKRRSTAAAK